MKKKAQNQTHETLIYKLLVISDLNFKKNKKKKVGGVKKSHSICLCLITPETQEPWMEKKKGCTPCRNCNFPVDELVVH